MSIFLLGSLRDVICLRLSKQIKIHCWKSIYWMFIENDGNVVNFFDLVIIVLMTGEIKGGEVQLRFWDQSVCRFVYL